MAKICGPVLVEVPRLASRLTVLGRAERSSEIRLGFQKLFIFDLLALLKRTHVLAGWLSLRYAKCGNFFMGIDFKTKIAYLVQELMLDNQVITTLATPVLPTRVSINLYVDTEWSPDGSFSTFSFDLGGGPMYLIAGGITQSPSTATKQNDQPNERPEKASPIMTPKTRLVTTTT